MREFMEAFWFAFYMTFNDDRYNKCYNSFNTNLNVSIEDSVIGIEKSNYGWVGETKAHGVPDNEIKGAYEQMATIITAEMGRALRKEEEQKLKKILFACKKLRLLLFEDCNRNCIGCCNKDFDIKNLPVCTDYTLYNKIMLTGGEPMLRPDVVLQAVSEIREQTNASIILYTAWAKDPEILGCIVDQIDGLTLTLHGPEDIADFKSFDNYYKERYRPYRTFRLNVFKEAGEIQEHSFWQVKNGIEWIENCPLPDNEVFMRYRPKS